MKVNSKVDYVKDKDKQDEVAILISDKINFKIKSITRNKEEYFIMINVSIHQEDITVIHDHACNYKVQKQLKEKLTKIRRKQTILHSWLDILTHPSPGI